MSSTHLRTSLLSGVMLALGVGLGLFFTREPADLTPVQSGLEATSSGRTSATPAATTASALPTVALNLPGARQPVDNDPQEEASPGQLGASPQAPPALSPAALAEGERVKAELGERGGRGSGRTYTLMEGFESEEEKEAYDERRMESWERRLRYELEIKIRGLREKVALTAVQEGELRQILEDEFQERQRLVRQLSAKTISNTSFDEAVAKNVATARQRLGELLTPEQLIAYGELKPREQVLRDEIK